MENKLRVEGMSCEHCVKRVKNIIEKFDGVSSVDVILDTKEAVFSCDALVTDVAEIIRAINDSGYKTSQET
jgi:copper ion binding protein